MEGGWKVTLGLVAGGLGAAVGVALARRYGFEQQVVAEVDMLAKDARDRPDRIIGEGDLEPLPEPVRRYLRFAGVIGRRPVRTVRASQTGAFKLRPDGEWKRLEAIEYYSTAPPGFVWYADVHSAPLLTTKVRDRYVAGRGAVLAQLGGALPIVDAKGPHVDQGAALRFLNEMVFFPTAYLEDYVRWEARDERSARVSMKHWSGELSATCYFAEDGRMTNFVAERYRDEGDAYVKREWQTPFGEYAEFDGFRVPASGRGVWTLDEGEYEYIRLNIQDVSYDRTLEA